MQKAIKIMIVENHNDFRRTLCSSLKEEGFPIIYEALNGKQAIDDLKNIQPDIIILDIRMPVMNGIEALGIIKENYPGIKVIMLTGMDSKAYITKSIIIGADAFLMKNCGIEVLVSVIKNINSNKTFVYENNLRRIPVSEELNAKKIIEQRALSSKEAEILVTLCDGKSRKLMAAHFNISESTVGFHIGNIYKKTKAADLVGLVKYAIENGYVSIQHFH